MVMGVRGVRVMVFNPTFNKISAMIESGVIYHNTNPLTLIPSVIILNVLWL